MKRALRIVRFPLVLLVIEAVALAAVVTLYSIGVHRLGASAQGVLGFAGGLGLAVLIVALWKGLRRWLEGSRDAEFTLRNAGQELGLGLVGGFVLFSAAAALVIALGGLQIEGVRAAGSLAGPFWAIGAMAVTSGVFEETLFRGVLLRHLEALLGSWAALAITALLFGLAHIANPDASLFAAAAIAVEAGVLLGAAYLLTRRLWLAVGIHAAWNFTQGWVFSIPVSGGAAPLGLLVTRRMGPEWLSGGAFGLEASVVALLMASAGGIALLIRAVRQGRLVSPVWRR